MSGFDFDLICLGRSSLDLFSQDIGAPFVDISGFTAHVGGSPTNIAIGSTRLGLRVALVTAVGADKVGDFILHTLRREGVDTRFCLVKAGTRSATAVLGIEPPDRFPLVFYRENPPDVQISIADLQTVPVARSRALLLSGLALRAGPLRDATLFAAEQARRSATTTFMDLDLRADQWPVAAAFGVNVRAILPLIDVIIGTEEELYAALAPRPDPVMAGECVYPTRSAGLNELLQALLARPWAPQAVVVKRGGRGVTVLAPGTAPVDVPAVPVTIVNTVGAGDAFASGFISGWVQGLDRVDCARRGNVCGAIVVTRHGCAAAMPTAVEVERFLTERNGGTQGTDLETKEKKA